MERRFATRLEELLDDAIVDPAVLRDMLPRLERFIQPFATLLATPEQGVHLQEYVSGLVSNVKRKNVESIAYRHDQDRQANHQGQKQSGIESKVEDGSRPDPYGDRQEARQDAELVLLKDPALKSPDHQALQETIQAQWASQQSVGMTG